MKTVTTPKQFDNETHLGVIIFPTNPTGRVEYVAFKHKEKLEAWATAELSKKTGQRSFRILEANPKTLQVEINGSVQATLA